MNLFERLQLSIAKRQLRARRAEFYFDLAMSLEDRVPLFSTFKKYEKRARKRDRGMALLYRHILKNSINGSLATALEGVAPASELMMLDAAQTAGDSSVAEGLRFLAGTVEKTERMTAAIKGAVMYPLFLISLFYAILMGFSFYAIPVLESIMPVNDWPASGKALAFVADSVRQYGLLMIAVNAALFLAFLYSLAHWSGASRRPFDKRLPYSVYRDYAGAMLIVSLASLMRSGISLRSSLEQAVRYSTPWMRWHVRGILRGISSANAENFGAAFGTGVLSQDLEDRIMDASERRDPVEAFVKIGTGSIDRIATSIEKSSARLNSVMLLLCGFALASMLLGFMATTQQLQSAVQKKTQQTSQRN